MTLVERPVCVWPARLRCVSRLRWANCVLRRTGGRNARIRNCRPGSHPDRQIVRSSRSISSGRPRRSSEITVEKVNVNGGAISMGHPVGMSGARLVLDVALELKRHGGGLGAAGLCGGGGQGDALIIRVPA